MISLGDIDDCKKALNYLGINEDQWDMEEGKKEKGYPKGCYQFVSEFTHLVYFNSHPNDSAQKESKPICKNG